MLFYTSNGCSLCEELWPLYIEAARRLHRTQNLLFTSIDMATNDLPDENNLFYYPSLRYYPKDSKYRPYNYDAGLSVEEIMQFVQRVSQVPLSDIGSKDELWS